MDFDQTQAIELDDYEDKTDDLSPDGEKSPSAYLKVPLQRGLKETKFPLFEGDNIIGRSADTCHVCIPSKSLSKEHACVQILGDSHLIFDKGSRNKTRRGKLFLSPDVRYELKNEDEITFADVKCVYEFSKQLDTVPESGSETDGSESLLLKHDVTEEHSFELEDEDNSVVDKKQSHSKDHVRKSEVMVGDTPENKRPDIQSATKAPLQTLVLTDSDSDDDETVGKGKSLVQETLLCEDSDPESSRDQEAFVAATQAYFPGENEGDADDEGASKDGLIGAATQAYGCLLEESDAEEEQAQKLTERKSGNSKQSSQLAGTQSFDAGTINNNGSNSGRPVCDDSDNKKFSQNDSTDSALKQTQVFEENDSEDDNVHGTGLFAVSTMACDFDDNVTDREDNDGEVTLKSAEDEPTQMVDIDAQTQKVVTKEDENANSDTFDIQSDATLAVAQHVKSKQGEKEVKPQGNKGNVVSPDTPTLVIENTLPAEAIGKVSSKGETCTDASDDLPTQVFDETLSVVSTEVSGKKSATPTRRRGRSRVTIETNDTQPTQVFDETQPVEQSESPPNRKMRSGKAIPLNSDAPTLPIDNTLPVSEVSAKAQPATRGRSKRAQSHQNATLNISDIVAVSEDRNISNQPKQVYGADCDEPTQLFGVASDEPTQLFAEASDVTTQAFDDIAGSPSKNSQKSKNMKNKIIGTHSPISKIKDTKPKVTPRKDISDEEDEDEIEKPWIDKEIVNEPTQAYGMENCATQAYDIDDEGDNENPVQLNEPTQAYNLCADDDDGDATQAFCDDEGVDTYKEEITDKQLPGVEDPTQRYDMVIEEEDNKEREKAKSSSKGDRTEDFDEEVDSHDDSDLEDESVLRPDAELSNDPTELSEQADNKQKVPNFEPTLQYDMAVEDKPGKRQQRSGKKQTGKSLKDDSTTNLPQIPVKDSKAKMIKKGTEDKTGSLSDTEEFVPDSGDEVEVKSVIALPSRSPLKSALVDRRRSPSPVPKRVLFAKMSIEKEGDTEPKELISGLRSGSRSQTAKRPNSPISTPPKGRKTGKAVNLAKSNTAAGNIEEEGGLKEISASESKGTVSLEAKQENEENDEGVKKEQGDGQLDSTPVSRSSTKKGTQSTDRGNLQTDQNGGGDVKIDTTKSETVASETVKETRTRGKRGKADNQVTNPGKEIKDESSCPEEKEDSQPVSKRGRRSVISKDIKCTEASSPLADSLPSRDRKRRVHTKDTQDHSLPTDVPGPSKKGKKSSEKDTTSVEDKQNEGNVSDETASIGSSVNDKEAGTYSVESSKEEEESTPSVGKRVTRGKAKKVDTVNEDKDNTEASETGPRVSSRGRRISTNPYLKDFDTKTKAGRGKRSVSASASAKNDEPSDENGSEESVAADKGPEPSKIKSGKGKRGNQVVNEEEMEQVSDSSMGPPSGVKGMSRRGLAKANCDEKKAMNEKMNTPEVDDERSKKDEMNPKEVVGTKNSRVSRQRGRKLSVSSEASDQTEESVETSLSDDRLGESKLEVDDTESSSIGRKSRHQKKSLKVSETPSKIVPKDPEPETSIEVLPAVTKRGRRSTKKESVNTQNSQTPEKKDSQDNTSAQSLASPTTKTNKVSAKRAKAGEKGKAFEVEDTVSGETHSQTPSRSSGKRELASSSTAPSDSSPSQRSRPSSTPQTPAQKKQKLQESVQSPVLRKSTLDHKPKVMFTGVIDEQGEKIVKELGGEMAETIQDCTHLVTDKVRRTVKFLSGLARGLLIVSPQWLESSKRAGTFIDGHNFLVSDPPMEKQYKFNLATSLSKANSNPVLSGYKVHVSKSVKPDPKQMQDILECAGAEYLKTMPSKFQDHTVVISCQEDQKLCQPAIKAGLPIVGAEFVLTGLLRQEVDIEAFLLIKEEGSSQGSVKGRGRRK